MLDIEKEGELFLLLYLEGAVFALVLSKLFTAS